MLRDEFDLDLEQHGSRRTPWVWTIPLVVMAGLAWFLAPWQEDAGWESPHAGLSYEVDHIDWSAVQRALVQPAAAADRATQSAILRLLSRAGRSNDAKSVAQSIDTRRLTDRILESGFVRPLNDEERADLAEAATAAVFVDFPTRGLQLISLQVTGPNEWIAYTRCRDRQRFLLVRWWISREGGTWKWFDWHMLGNRRMMSEEIAVNWVYHDDPLWTGAFFGGPWSQAGGPPLSLIRDHWYQEKRRSAVEKLQAAETRLVHRFVSDPYRIELARALAEFRRYADARRLLAQVERPSEVPDYFLIAADCLAADGQFEDARAQIDSYEACLGPTVESARRRLAIARRMGNRAAALQACETWYARDPLASEPVLAAAELSDGPAWEHWVARLGDSRWSGRVLRSAIASAVVQDRRAGWAPLQTAAKSIMPQSGWDIFLAARRAEADGRWKQATDQLAIAVQRADEETKRWWNEDLIRLLIETRQWKRLLHDPAGPAHALFTLLTRTNWDSEPFAPGELIALATAYRQEHPESKWGDILLMEAAFVEGDWVRVWDTFRFSPHQAELRRSERARHRAVFAHSIVAGPITALQHATRKLEAIEIIGTRLVDEQRWDELAVMAAAVGQLPNADDPSVQGWLNFFAAAAALAKSHADEARHHLLVAIDQANLTDQPNWILNRAVPLLIRNSLDEGNWRQVLADPRVGAREWPLWIDELNRRLAADPAGRAQFEAFLDAFEEYYDAEPEAVWWRAKLAFDQQDWASVRATLWPWPEETTLVFRSQREARCREMLARSLTELGDWRSLQQFAVQAAAVGDRRWLVWHAVLAGSPEGRLPEWGALNERERAWLMGNSLLRPWLVPLLVVGG